MIYLKKIRESAKVHKCGKSSKAFDFFRKLDKVHKMENVHKSKKSSRSLRFFFENSKKFTHFWKKGKNKMKK